MTSWADGLLVGFDTETSATDPEEARIVTASLTRVDPNREVTDLKWVLNPGIELTPENVAIHGYSAERLAAEGEAPAKVLSQIHDMLLWTWANDGVVVIFNASYDLTVLDRELARIDPTAHLLTVGPTVDPMVIDRALDPYRKGKRSLDLVCEHYGIVRGEIHNSSDDALAGVRLAWKFAQLFPVVGSTGRQDLNRLQEGWRSAWAVDFAEYLRKQGREAEIPTIRGEWPLVPRRPVVVP